MTIKKRTLGSLISFINQSKTEYCPEITIGSRGARPSGLLIPRVYTRSVRGGFRGTTTISQNFIFSSHFDHLFVKHSFTLLFNLRRYLLGHHRINNEIQLACPNRYNTLNGVWCRYLYLRLESYALYYIMYMYQTLCYQD